MVRAEVTLTQDQETEIKAKLAASKTEAVKMARQRMARARAAKNRPAVVQCEGSVEKLESGTALVSDVAGS